jgi:hypothetical protein
MAVGSDDLHAREGIGEGRFGRPALRRCANDGRISTAMVIAPMETPELPTFTE